MFLDHDLLEISVVVPIVLLGGANQNYQLLHENDLELIQLAFVAVYLILGHFSLFSTKQNRRHHATCDMLSMHHPSSILLLPPHPSTFVPHYQTEPS
jgi:hypothetical protein